MKQRKLPTGYKVYLPLVLTLVIFMFMLPRAPRFGYEYKKGETWMYETLQAEFDFPILKTSKELQAEKDSVKHEKVPYFDKNYNAARNAVAAIDVEDKAVADVLRQSIEAVYGKGIFSYNDAKQYEDLSDKSECAILTADQQDSFRVPRGEIHDVESARAYVRNSLKSIRGINADSLAVALRLDDIIVPDLEYNRTITDQKYDDRIYHPSYTSNYISRAEVIVEKGEMITDDIANLLDSYKAEFDKSVGYSGNRTALWTGLFIVALVMVVIFFFTLYFCAYHIFSEYNKYLYVLLLYVLFSCVTLFFYSRGEVESYYMIPYSLMAMLMMAFFRKGFVMIMYLITLFPLLIVTSGTVSVFFMHLVAGVMGVYIYQTFNKGWTQFVGTFMVFIIMVLVWIGFCLMFDTIGNLYLLMYIALAAGLSIAGYPLIYLFEKMFRLVSSDKLVELSDTSNELLRLLADKAPGTFHHSLQVMNLADAAARAIDADIPLVRAAALYHDIGKIKNPQCFTENEVQGVNVHEGLTPKESAQLIIKHVSDGLALAEQHNLPLVLRQFIESHHGTTCASYFLTKHLNAGGDPAEAGDFRYDGVTPATKEQVILMLSDAVEAASRSLKDYSSESISKLVDKIIDGKANEGQLNNADITLKELNTIREVMKSFVQQVYHSRIEYPKLKKSSRK